MKTPISSVETVNVPVYMLAVSLASIGIYILLKLGLIVYFICFTLTKLALLRGGGPSKLKEELDIKDDQESP